MKELPQKLITNIQISDTYIRVFDVYSEHLIKKKKNIYIYIFKSLNQEAQLNKNLFIGKYFIYIFFVVLFCFSIVCFAQKETQITLDI